MAGYFRFLFTLGLSIYPALSFVRPICAFVFMDAIFVSFANGGSALQYRVFYSDLGRARSSQAKTADLSCR